MEVLAAGSSIITIAATLTRCCTMLISCAKSLKYARKEVDNIANATSEFSGSLRLLDGILDESQAKNHSNLLKL